MPRLRQVNIASFPARITSYNVCYTKLLRIFARLAPDGDPAYVHDAEGPDDMSAHARSVLTSNSLTIPVAGARLLLGTWQGIYLWEHRRAPHTRNVVVTVTGE